MFLPGPGLVHRRAICLRGQRDVLRVFITAFDLKRRDPRRHDPGNLFERVKIAGR